MSDLALVEWQPKTTAVPPWRVLAAAGAWGLTRVLRHPLATASGLFAGMACLLLLALPAPRPAKSADWRMPGITSTDASAASPVALRPPSMPLAVHSEAAPASWTDIVKPLEIYSLETPDFASASKSYAAKRVTSGGRRDVLTLGSLEGSEPAIRLSFYRRGSEAYAPVPLFADIARQAAEASFAVTRSSLPDLLMTRFGPMEVTNVGLHHVGATSPETVGTTPRPERASLAASDRSCSGFRLIVADPAFTLARIACGDHNLAMTRERLGCLMDRLDLTSGGDDQPLVAYFAASELRRNGACRGAHLGPDQLHAAWLDDKPAADDPVARSVAKPHRQRNGRVLGRSVAGLFGKSHGRVATHRRIVRHR